MTTFDSLRKAQGKGTRRQCRGCGLTFKPYQQRGRIQVILAATEGVPGTKTKRTGMMTSRKNGDATPPYSTKTTMITNVTRSYCEDCSVDLYTKIEKLLDS